MISIWTFNAFLILFSFVFFSVQRREFVHILVNDILMKNQNHAMYKCGPLIWISDQDLHCYSKYIL